MVYLDELWDDYLEYLIWRCGLQKFAKYGKLFEILHNIEFTYILDRDGNRHDDGADLRFDYNIPDCFNENLDEDFYSHWTSVLEMLIALAIKVDDEIIGDPSEEHPEEFFMKMIDNLGLLKYKGNRYKEDNVIKIIDRWLNREFDRDGNGSPFPIKYNHRDQREVEIWDQMNAYISENYE